MIHAVHIDPTYQGYQAWRQGYPSVMVIEKVLLSPQKGQPMRLVAFFRSFIGSKRLGWLR